MAAPPDISAFKAGKAEPQTFNQVVSGAADATLELARMVRASDDPERRDRTLDALEAIVALLWRVAPDPPGCRLAA